MITPMPRRVLAMLMARLTDPVIEYTAAEIWIVGHTVTGEARYCCGRYTPARKRCVLQWYNELRVKN